jgi:hypothetical protein
MAEPVPFFRHDSVQWRVYRDRFYTAEDELEARDLLGLIAGLQRQRERKLAHSRAMQNIEAQPAEERRQRGHIPTEVRRRRSSARARRRGTRPNQPILSSSSRIRLPSPRR